MNIYERLKIAYLAYAKEYDEDNALVVEYLFQEHLKEFPYDIQAHIQYAIFLYFPPHNDCYGNLEYLYKALALDPENQIIIILIVYLKPMCSPTLEDSLLEKVKNPVSTDPKIIAMPYFSLAEYYGMHKPDLYELTMLKSINSYPYLFNNRYYLAEYYLKNKRFKEGKKLSELALQNLKEIIGDEAESLDQMIDNFINYYITGTRKMDHTREGLIEFIQYADYHLMNLEE